MSYESMARAVLKILLLLLKGLTVTELILQTIVEEVEFKIGSGFVDSCNKHSEKMNVGDIINKKCVPS